MNSPVDKGLRLEVNWHDADVLRICIACWNGMFGGVADAYVEIGKLEQTAQKLQGARAQPCPLQAKARSDPRTIRA